MTLKFTNNKMASYTNSASQFLKPDTQSLSVVSSTGVKTRQIKHFILLLLLIINQTVDWLNPFHFVTSFSSHFSENKPFTHSIKSL